MSNIKYTAPKVDIVELGNEDVCTASKWTPDVNGPGIDITEEDKDHPFTDGDF